MEETLQNDTGWRGSPELWLEAAYEALLEGGVDSVKILALATRLGLSRTSFYWFFKDREALLAALLTRWREKNTGNLIKRAEAYADTIAEAVLNIFDCWFDRSIFDSRHEFAVRSWALRSPDILAEVQAADQIRLKALAGMFQRFGYPEGMADVRSRSLYLVQIGYISMQMQEDVALRMTRIADYVEIFTGEPPARRDLDRFFARYGHRPDAPPSSP